MELNEQLLEACRAGDAALVADLLAQGADPNTHYFDEAYPDAPLSALYVATGECDYPEVARLLLAAGANTQDGESIYHAAQYNHVECLQALAGYGADFSVSHHKWRNTPLYFLMWPVAGEAGQKQLDGVRWLLEHGADPNVPSGEALEVPLHRAVRWPDAVAVELLTSHGANADAKTRDGVTPYALAMRLGNEAAANALMGQGASTELSPKDELLATCARGDQESARGLLAQSPGLVATLTSSDLELLPELAGEGKLDAVHCLLDIGLPIDARGEMGATALHHAAWRGQLGTVKFLLERGAPLEGRDSEYEASPLQWAMHGSENCKDGMRNYAEVAAALIEAGAAVPENVWGSAEVQAVLSRYQQSI